MNILPDNDSPQEEVRRINPGRLRQTTLIDMVELGHGCTGDCIACGAFQGEYTSEERQVCPITPEKLGQNITQEIYDIQSRTRIRLLDLFRTYMTAGVDMEPSESDIFNEAAELIYRLSEGKSRMVAILHGLRCTETKDEATGVIKWEFIKGQLERLGKMSQLMKDDVIARTILSIDAQRCRGLLGKDSKQLHDKLKELDGEGSNFMQIIKECAEKQQREQDNLTNSIQQETADQWNARLMNTKKSVLAGVQNKIQKQEPLNLTETTVREYIDLKDALRVSVVEANARSFAATVFALKPAIDAGKAVTFSLQGDENEDSLVYVGLTYEIYQRMLDILEKEFGVTQDDLRKMIGELKVQPPVRYFTAAGRAKILLNITKETECTVIPDDKFVKTEFRCDPFKINRGRIRGDGTLQIQLCRPKRTYNDTVLGDDPSYDNPWMDVNLTAQKTETIEIAESLVLPSDFLNRLRVNAGGRRYLTYLPTETEEKISKLSQIYPLSQIKDDGPEGLVTTLIGEGILDKDVADRRLCIVKALIPSLEIGKNKNEGELPDQTKTRLAEEIIKIYTPDIGQAKDKLPNSPIQIGAREMGKILAIQALLKERGIEIKLMDEEA